MDGLQPEVTFFDSTGLVFTWQEWFGHYDVRARGYTMSTVSVEDAVPAPASTLTTLARPSVFRTNTTIEFDVAVTPHRAFVSLQAWVRRF